MVEVKITPPPPCAYVVQDVAYNSKTFRNYTAVVRYIKEGAYMAAYGGLIEHSKTTPAKMSYRMAMISIEFMDDRNQEYRKNFFEFVNFLHESIGK